LLITREAHLIALYNRAYINLAENLISSEYHWQGMILHIQQRQNWIRSRRQRRKLAKRARLRRQVLRYFSLVALLTIGLCVFKYVPCAIANADSQLAVQGNQVVLSRQVRNAVSKQMYRPLYQLDPQSLSQNICSLQDVQYCFVRRFIFPRPRIIAQVLEEFPWASLSHQPGEPAFGVISESGRTISIDSFPRVIKPSLTIYTPPNTKFDSASVAQWATWVNNIQAQTGKPVSYVDMRNSEDIRIMDSDLYLKIGCADSTLDHRLSRLASIMPTLQEFKNRLAYVDLSLENNIPIRVADKSVIAARATTGIMPE
jgi:cell division septal protein FtsQ